MSESVWTITIPDYWPPSLNRTRGVHWSKRHQEKRRAIDLVHFTALEQTGELPRFKGPVTVKLMRIYKGRKKAVDPDNLHGSIKPLLDALRKQTRKGRGWQGGLGIIQDDDPESLTLQVEQRRAMDGEPDLAAQVTVIGEVESPRSEP